jgi:hypothetical protein
MALYEERQANHEKRLDDAELERFVDKCRAVASRVDDDEDKFQALLVAVDACGSGGTYRRAQGLRSDTMRHLLPMALKNPNRQTLLLITFGWVGRTAPDEIVLERNEYRSYIDAIVAETNSTTIKAAGPIPKIYHLTGQEYNTALSVDERSLALRLIDKLETQVDALDDYWGYGIHEKIDGWRRSLTRNLVGSAAMEIEGEDLDGVRFKLSDYRGKVVVLDFWGYW